MSVDQSDPAWIRAAEALIDAVTFDDSGSHGQGGNGGLLSRETIRKADALRLVICEARRAARGPDDATAEVGE